ncbi:MAG: IS200/IS605 family transposase [Candidatus Aenigmarchaeota archaeon]|nr:IS200/IS605 family transposase [Candidatus Aenigmarchaeota archaeon]
MSEFVRGSSSIFRLEAHISFKVKYCHDVFDIIEFKERCTELLLEAAAGIGIEVTELGYDRNHVHLDIRWMRICLSVDQISKKLKGTTGRKLLKEFPGIKKRFFWGSGLWSPVIYGDSLGKDPINMHNYVANQGKKSSKYTTTLVRFFNQ